MLNMLDMPRSERVNLWCDSFIQSFLLLSVFHRVAQLCKLCATGTKTTATR